MYLRMSCQSTGQLENCLQKLDFPVEFQLYLAVQPPRSPRETGNWAVLYSTWGWSLPVYKELSTACCSKDLCLGGIWGEGLFVCLLACICNQAGLELAMQPRWPETLDPLASRTLRLQVSVTMLSLFNLLFSNVYIRLSCLLTRITPSMQSDCWPT